MKEVLSEMTKKRKGKVGSSFDGFLAEESEERAIKQILANQIKTAKEKDRLTKGRNGHPYANQP